VDLAKKIKGLSEATLKKILEKNGELILGS
jgi:hypothetical protein